jgi:hypothetical protein
MLHEFERKIKKKSRSKIIFTWVTTDTGNKKRDVLLKSRSVKSASSYRWLQE